MISVRIQIEGEKVQEVGYRLFLLEKALENGIEKIYARNLDKNEVELLIIDVEDKINNFYEVIKRKIPEATKVKDVKMEPYTGKINVPTIDRYFQFLTLEQLNRGREEIVHLPKSVSEAIEPVTSALKGIDETFGRVVERFGIFGEYAIGIDERLKGIDDKLDKISTLPEKIDILPERIAKALGSEKNES